MASGSGAEARSDDRNEDAVDPRDAAARAIYDGADSGPYTRPWDPKFGPCPARTHLEREVRRRLGAETRCTSFDWLKLANKLKTLHPFQASSSTAAA